MAVNDCVSEDRFQHLEDRFLNLEKRLDWRDRVIACLLFALLGINAPQGVSTWQRLVQEGDPSPPAGAVQHRLPESVPAAPARSESAPGVEQGM